MGAINRPGRVTQSGWQKFPLSSRVRIIVQRTAECLPGPQLSQYLYVVYGPGFGRGLALREARSFADADRLFSDLETRQ